MASAGTQLLYLSAMLGAAFGQGVYTTTVTPRAGDDILAPASMSRPFPQAGLAARAVWVIFDRGREITDLYNDPAVFRFADKEGLALLLARHCRSKDREDMDVDPAKGIGHALFQALDQLAKDSQHGELATAKVIVFGFSGAGSLAARTPGFAPDRLLAAIDYAPGQYEPLGMDTIESPPAAAAIPQLIIANGADSVNGAKRPVEFFRKYFDKGSTWVLAIQNGVPHDGGLANAKPLIFARLKTILRWEAGTPRLVAVLEDCADREARRVEGPGGEGNRGTRGACRIGRPRGLHRRGFGEFAKSRERMAGIYEAARAQGEHEISMMEE